MLPSRVSTALDAEVERLLVEHVATFDKLELLFLTRREPVVWTAVAASSRLGLPQPMVELALAELSATGLLVREAGGFRTPTTGTPLELVAQRLCDVYEQDRSAVLEVLTRAAFKRIRLTAAHRFADAFRFRIPDPDDDPEKGGSRG